MITNFNTPDLDTSRLPKPLLEGDLYQAKWNAVPLFFNLPANQQPADYLNTDEAAINELLGLGGDQSDTLSYFLTQYWAALSYGNFSFGVKHIKENDSPSIPELSLIDGTEVKKADDWHYLIKAHLSKTAESVWKAADPAGNGFFTPDGMRYIPSVFLVQRYEVIPQAGGDRFTVECNGVTYFVGDKNHIGYNKPFFNSGGGSISDYGESIWGVLAHEFSHNFIQMGDIYGPSGNIGYWDLLGDQSKIGRMQEILSTAKEGMGWIKFKEDLKGFKLKKQSYSLRPYSTSGDAIKIVPDPFYSPNEFFILEYRKSMGKEVWRPDGAIQEAGLLITHVNANFPQNHVPWTLRESPLYDIEKADFTDLGTAEYIGFDKISGSLFFSGTQTSFGRWTQPNSNFYGERSSGLDITNIQVNENEVTFDVEIDGYQQVGWPLSAGDQFVAGRFSLESLTKGKELLVKSDLAYSLIECRQAVFQCVFKHLYRIAGFSLSDILVMLPGNFNSVDDCDELFVRTATATSILKLRRNSFEPMQNYLALWTPEASDKEYVVNLLGNKQQQILLQRGNQLVLWNYADGQMEVLAQVAGQLGTKALGSNQQLFFSSIRGQASQEMLIFDGGSLVVACFDLASRQFSVLSNQEISIDGWTFNPSDQFTFADLDGDGAAEIYVRSADCVGIFKWNGTKLVNTYVTQYFIENENDDTNSRLSLAAGDRSYGASVFVDRQGIYHQNANGFYIVGWDAQKSRLQVEYRHNTWNFFTLSADDHIIVDDFHRIGADISTPSEDFVVDNLDDVFIYNANRTQMLSVNPVDGRRPFAVCWRRDENLLLQTPGTPNRTVLSVSEDHKGRNQQFLETSTGKMFDRETFVFMIEAGLYPEYHVRLINGVKTPISNPNSTAEDNLEPN